MADSKHPPSSSGMRATQTEAARRSRGKIRLQFSLPLDVEEQLRDLSEDTGESMSELVEEALRAHLARR
jgi:hypothetical protein